MPSTDDTITHEKLRTEYVGRHGKPTLRERIGCLPLLAAVLVTAVLLVGVVSALKPTKGGALGILPPDPSVSQSDDGGDPYATDGNDASGSPSPGSSSRPGKKPTPTKSPSPVSVPTTPVGLPPGTSPSASPSRSGSPSPVPSMAPFTQEGEAASLLNGARRRTVSAASGGAVAGYVGMGGTVTFNGINAPVAGTYTMVIWYISGAQRTTVVNVNGGPGTSMVLPTTADWSTVASVTVKVFLKAGSNSVQFGNPNNWASDIDKINIH